jgi:hypothetical protein
MGMYNTRVVLYRLVGVVIFVGEGGGATRQTKALVRRFLERECRASRLLDYKIALKVTVGSLLHLFVMFSPPVSSPSGSDGSMNN